MTDFMQLPFRCGHVLEHCDNTCPICEGTGEHTPQDLFNLCHDYPAGIPKLMERVYQMQTGKTPDQAINEYCHRCNGTGLDPWADLAAKQIED